MNAAIKAARFGVITRVDGHAMLPPGYLRTAVGTLLETGAADVGGVMAAEGVSRFEQAVAWAMTSKAGVGGASFHTGGEPGPVDSVYLGVYRRDAIEKAGGYDEEYLRAEDWELNHRIRLSGGVVWFEPELRVTYRPRSTPRALGAQYFHYGRWRRVVARQHAGTINLRYLAPPAAVSVIAAGSVVGRGRPGRMGGRRAAGVRWLSLGLVIPGHLRGRDHRGGRGAGPRRAARRAGPDPGRAGHHAPVLGRGLPDQLTRAAAADGAARGQLTASQRRPARTDGQPRGGSRGADGQPGDRAGR